MNLHQLEWFCCAYETRSFAKAAEQMFVSRQAFGKAIKTMEGELGASLFERDAGGVVPTEFAELIFPAVQSCITDYRIILKTRDEYIADRRQQVRLALAYGVAAALPDDFFEQLQRYNPLAEFLIEKHSIAHCLDLLEEGKVDFAIGSQPADDRSLKRLPLIRYDLFIATSKKLLKDCPENYSLEDLASLTFFMLGDDFPTDKALAQIFESQGLELKTNEQYQDYDIILKEVKRGHGASIVPANCLDQVAEDHVAILPFPDSTFCWELNLFYVDCPHTEVERRVIDFIDETY